MTSEPSSTQSTDPRSQWPTPAIKVSGTAWAISEPTRRAIGMRADRAEREPSCRWRRRRPRRASRTPRAGARQRSLA
jgi:hypothetical protein